MQKSPSRHFWSFSDISIPPKFITTAGGEDCQLIDIAFFLSTRLVAAAGEKADDDNHKGDVENGEVDNSDASNMFGGDGAAKRLRRYETKTGELAAEFEGGIVRFWSIMNNVMGSSIIKYDQVGHLQEDTRSAYESFRNNMNYLARISMDVFVDANQFSRLLNLNNRQLQFNIVMEDY